MLDFVNIDLTLHVTQMALTNNLQTLEYQYTYNVHYNLSLWEILKHVIIIFILVLFIKSGL